MPNSPNLQDVIGTDPLARLLDRSRGKPWQFGLGFLLFAIVFVVALPWAYGVLLPETGLQRSSLTDYMNQMSFGLVLPAAAFFYAWQPAAIARVYGAVCGLDSSSQLAAVLRVIRASHARRRWWLIALLCGAVLVVLGLLDNLPLMGAAWFNANWIMLALLQFSRFVLFYLLIMCALRHALAASSLNAIYRQMHFPVMVAPTGYTSAFSIISNYTLAFASLGAVIGLYLGLRPFVSPPPMPEYAIFVCLYFVIVPAGFFLPFWQPHRKMLAARQQRLAFLHGELQAEYERLQLSLTARARRLASSERLSALRDLVALTEKAPVWPFEVLAVYRLIVTVLLPFTLLGINYLLGILQLLR